MAREAYYSGEHFAQQRRMLANGDPRAPICFCVDVSESMGTWWVQEGGLSRYGGSGESDGQRVRYFDVSDILPGYEHYRKIDKLNETLQGLLREFKADAALSEQVAVSVITYSKYADVRLDFIDSEALDLRACVCKVKRDNATAMGDALRVSLAQLDEMREEMRAADNDCYTPILVFLTDGTPTDDPREEFDEIRERVDSHALHVFPLGIGEGADMARLRDMFPPPGMVPARFSERYKMVRPADYQAMFQEIKSRVRRHGRVMVSESDSNQSRAAVTGPMPSIIADARSSGHGNQALRLLAWLCERPIGRVPAWH